MVKDSQNLKSKPFQTPKSHKEMDLILFKNNTCSITFRSYLWL